MPKIFRLGAYALVILGALNWGSVGLFDTDLVAYMFGDMTILARAFYTLIGISALVSLATVYFCCQKGGCD